MPELNQIRQSTLAAVICDSSDDIRAVPLDTFRLIHEENNPLVDCDDVPRVALSMWKGKKYFIWNYSQL